MDDPHGEYWCMNIAGWYIDAAATGPTGGIASTTRRTGSGRAPVSSTAHAPAGRQDGIGAGGSVRHRLADDQRVRLIPLHRLHIPVPPGSPGVGADLSLPVFDQTAVVLDIVLG